LCQVLSKFVEGLKIGMSVYIDMLMRYDIRENFSVSIYVHGVILR